MDVTIAAAASSGATVTRISTSTAAPSATAAPATLSNSTIACRITCKSSRPSGSGRTG